LNEDLSREYQAIIAYVVYSQVLSGAQYMDIAAQLEIHAKQELDHALILSRQIDYLGKMPVVTPKPVRTSKNPTDMLQYDLDNENETIRNYRDCIRQCETLGEYAMAEQIRQILMQEQDHQIDLATARHTSSRRQRWSQRTRLAQAALTLLASPAAGGSEKFATHDGAEDVRTRGRELLWVEGQHIHRLLSWENARQCYSGTERDVKPDVTVKGIGR
jgi:bacterioferritin